MSFSGEPDTPMNFIMIDFIKQPFMPHSVFDMSRKLNAFLEMNCNQMICKYHKLLKRIGIYRSLKVRPSRLVRVKEFIFL